MDLRSQVNELIMMLEHPKVFITNYFGQLMNHVDLETSKFIASNNLSMEQALEWNVAMISKLKESESECLLNIKKDFRFNDNLQTQIQNVIDRFKDEQSIDLEDLVYKSSTEAQQLLLDNKCYLIFDKECFQHLKIKCSNPNCTIICINDDVIRQNDLSHLKEMSRKDRSFYLTETDEIRYTSNLNTNQIKRNKFWKETLKISILQTKMDSLKTIKRNSIPFFRLDRLIDVDLYDLNITEIDETIFEDFENIESINLNKNYLFTLPERIFQGLNNLWEIDLSCNRLESLKLNTFQNLRCLNELDLSYNQITKIESTIFNNLSNLTRLNLGYNRLSSLDPYIFHGLSKLKWLTLFHNQLSYLDESTFKSLVKLVELELNNNKLESIHFETFKNLINIKHVDLRNNSKEIESIEKSKFVGIKQETKFLI